MSKQPFMSKLQLFKIFVCGLLSAYALGWGLPHLVSSESDLAVATSFMVIFAGVLLLANALYTGICGGDKK